MSRFKVVCVNHREASDNLIKRSTQRENVCSLVNLKSIFLFGTRIRGSVQTVIRRLRTLNSFFVSFIFSTGTGSRRAPVKHNRRPELPAHNVLRFDVAMQHTNAVCVSDGVAGANQTLNQPNKIGILTKVLFLVCILVVKVGDAI